jgi:hypothetical protein
MTHLEYTGVMVSTIPGLGLVRLLGSLEKTSGTKICNPIAENPVVTPIPTGFT